MILSAPCLFRGSLAIYLRTVDEVMIRECNVVAGGGREEIVGIGASGSTRKPALTKWRFIKLPMDAGEVVV